MKKLIFAFALGILFVSCSSSKETAKKPEEKKEEQKKIPAATQEFEEM